MWWYIGDLAEIEPLNSKILRDVKKGNETFTFPLITH